MLKPQMILNRTAQMAQTLIYIPILLEVCANLVHGKTWHVEEIEVRPD